MGNIFASIISSIPAPPRQDVLALQNLASPPKQDPTVVSDTMSMEDAVSTWQKNSSKENTSAILKMMKPTMDSAINSYAQGMEREVRVPAATITLSALKNWDRNAGASPSAYVFNSLKRLNRISASRSAIIKYPEKAMAESKAVRDFMTKFEDDNGREPSLTEIADKLGMDEKKVDRLLSTNMVVSESSTIPLDSFESQLGSKDLTQDDYFEYVYRSVGPVDQKIMEWSSGKHGKPMMSNNQIAQKLRISPAAVSQRKAKLQSKISDVMSLL